MDRAETPFTEAARPGRRVGHRVELHDAIGSTSDRARELLAHPGGEGTAVVAEMQTDGRGRRGRSWSSPPGRNLMVSVAHRPRLGAAGAWRLGLAVALAVHDACRAVAPVHLKWPNDLVSEDGRKAGGMLVESVIEGDRVRLVVIGIGINVNWAVDEMPADISGTATSLREMTGGPVDRGALLAQLLDRLDAELAALDGGASLLGRYRAACSTLGSEVTVEIGSRTIRGTAVDVDEAGALVIRTPSGLEAVASGEVTRVRRAVPA